VLRQGAERRLDLLTQRLAQATLVLPGDAETGLAPAQQRISEALAT
jgi:hypothetical protein